MEKLIEYGQGEIAISRQLDFERIQALAQVGALMLDLETAKKHLDFCNEKRNNFVKQVLANNGITQFDSARPTKEGVVATIPDELKLGRPNGGEFLAESR
jgi:uncharacterized membrane-anchored protein